MALAPPLPPRKKKSSLKEYKRGEPEVRLARALNNWRQATTAAKYGEAILKDMGSSVVLTNGQLERLVDCAHFGKVTTMDQLNREVQWSSADEFGQDVLNIILAECPPQPRIRKRRKKAVASNGSTVRQPLGTNTQVLNLQPAGSASGVSV